MNAADRADPVSSPLYAVDFDERALEAALALNAALPALAAELDAPVWATSLVRGPAWVLGSRQRAHGRAGAVLRRSTTGSAAFVETSALVHALALPRVDSVFRDATPRTLLNRNVRGFLRGYRGLGIKANWGGREYFRAVDAPLGLLAYDLLATGAVLVEAWVGIESTAVVEASGAVRPGASLCALLGGTPDPAEVTAKITRGAADKLEREPVRVLAPSSPRPARSEPPELSFAELLVPIGRLEAAIEPGARPRVWLCGDVLSSNAVFDEIETRAARALEAGAALTPEIVEPLRAGPLEGARPEDVLEVLERAANARANAGLSA